LEVTHREEELWAHAEAEAVLTEAAEEAAACCPGGGGDANPNSNSNSIGRRLPFYRKKRTGLTSLPKRPK